MTFRGLFLRAFLVFLTIEALPTARSWGTPAPKNFPRGVILLIGDGMGPQQLGLLEAWHKEVHEKPSTYAELTTKGTVAIVHPAPAGYLTTDSACSATEMATGVSSLPSYLGLDAQKHPVESVMKRVVRRGWRTGVVTDTRVTHATPAAFYATVDSRKKEREIAAQLVESNLFLALGGGGSYFTASEKQPDLLLRAREKGFVTPRSSSELRESKGRTLGLFGAKSLPNAIAHERKTAQTEGPTGAEDVPSLFEMTREALRILEAKENPFFLMVEAGQIDWAGHANDPGWLLAEMQRFHETLSFLSEWRTQHPDVLLLVTADHETGGFSFAYKAGCPGETSRPLFCPFDFIEPSVLKTLDAQKATFGEIFREYDALPWWRRSRSKLISLIEAQTGYRLSSDEAARLQRVDSNPHTCEDHEDLAAKGGAIPSEFAAFYPYIESNRTALLARALSRQTGIVWSTGTHTSTPILLLALGPGASQFQGTLSQVDVGRLLLTLTSDES